MTLRFLPQLPPFILLASNSDTVVCRPVVARPETLPFPPYLLALAPMAIAIHRAFLLVYWRMITGPTGMPLSFTNVWVEAGCFL